MAARATRLATLLASPLASPLPSPLASPPAASRPQDTAKKMQVLSKLRSHILHVFVPAPLDSVWQNATGVPTGFIPYIGGKSLPPLNYSALPYEYDVAFTSAMEMPATREARVLEPCSDARAVCERRATCSNFEVRMAHYPKLRRAMACSVPELRAAGLRVMNGLVSDYSLLVSTTKIVPATTEHSLLGVRIMTVLSSARALLISDRDEIAYSHLGLVDGVHAVLVSNASEFVSKVRYYADPAHEAERLQIVEAGARLVQQTPLRRHAEAALTQIRSSLRSWRGESRP